MLVNPSTGRAGQVDSWALWPAPNLLSKPQVSERDLAPENKVDNTPEELTPAGIIFLTYTHVHVYASCTHIQDQKKNHQAEKF